jgi:hypothetical protein
MRALIIERILKRRDTGRPVTLRRFSKENVSKGLYATLDNRY